MNLSRFLTKSRSYRREMLLQQLEERIVLDAAVSAQDNPDNQAASQPDAQTAPDGGTGAAAAAAASGDAGLVAPVPENFEQVFGQEMNVVLVASNLADVSAISSAASPDAKVVIYDAQQDNVATIASMLQEVVATEGHKIDNLVIIGHGTEGVLNIGAEQLQVLSLAEHEASFQQWGQLLADDAQIQFYACSLAGDVYGQALVDEISVYTSADVFASIDVTGGADGDWDLEYASSPDVAMHSVLTNDMLTLVESELAASLVLDINPGTATSMYGTVDFTNAGSYLIFQAYTAAGGYEPWVSDGTAAGTYSLEIYAGSGSSSPTGFTKVGNYVYFAASTAADGQALWKTDGTIGGTTMVKDLRPTTTATASITNLYEFNGNLYFTGTDGVNGIEIWVSDGTEAGTQMLDNLTAGASSSTVANFTEMGGELYFSLGAGTAAKLWKTDGTAGGTQQVASVPYGVNYITNLNGTLFFSAQGPGAQYTNAGAELWTSDGTDAGTEFFKDIYAGGFSSSPNQLTVVGDSLYFIAYDGNAAYGSEIWVTDGVDGTAAHTYVLDTVAGTGSSAPNWLTESGGKLFWSARTISTGSTYYLFTHDPVVGGSPTQLTTTAAYNLADGGNTLYFSAAATGAGTELWSSNGTVGGTGLFEDVNPGTASSSPANMTFVNGTLFFSATGSSTTGNELYKVEISPPSQFPVNTLGTAGPFTEDTSGVDLGSAFTVGDPDAGDTLTVTVSSTAFSGFSVDGVNYSPSLNLTGTEADINTALGNLTGNLKPDFSGTAGITITTTDQNDLSDSDTLAVEVTGSPDLPSLTLPTTARTFGEDIYYQIGLANSTSVWSVADPDPGDILTVDFSVLPVAGFPDIAGYASISVDGYTGTYAETGQLVGTVDQINAWMQNQLHVYVAPNFNGVAQLYVKVTDSTGNFVEDVYDAITISAVNDAPVNSVPGTQATDEDTPVTFNATNGNLISVSDVDADPGEVRVTLNATNGAATLSGLTGLTFLSGDGTDDASMQFTGTLADVNAALDGLVFTPLNEGFDYSTADASLQIITNDQGNSGGFALQDTDTINITVDPVPDTPVNTANSFAVPEGTTVVNLGSALSVHDGDPGDTLFVELTTGDGFTGLSWNGGTYVSSMMLSGTETLINSILSGLTGELPVGYMGDATINILTHDIGGLQDADTLTVNVSGASVLNILPVGPFSEDGGQVSLGGLITVSDPEGDPLTVTLAVTGGYDSLNATASGAAVVTGDGTANMTIEGTAQDINDTLVTLLGTLTADFFGTANIDVSVTDGVNVANGALAADVSAINDAPVNTVPGPAATDEDVPIPITGISISDVDAGSAAVQVTLSAGHGTLQVNDAVGGGVTAAQITGNATSSVVLTGTLAEINATLADATGLQYTPDLNFASSDAITVFTSDLGATGTPGPLTDTDSIAITVAPDAVNDAPVVTVPGSYQQADSSGAVIFNSANGNLISVSDDAGSGLVKVTLTATHGTLSLSGVAGLTFDPGQDGIDDVTMTFTGTLADVNSALDGMSFNRDAGYLGLADVTVAVDDQGNTGTGGALTDTQVANISVEPYLVWFQGFGPETGWDVYNYTDGSYYTHDYTVYWQYLTASTSWNFWNGSAWVPTDALGNAPYGDGFGPFGTWFADTVVGGTYENYDVYIDLGMTYYSPDHTAAGATYWRVSSAGDWGYYDGSAWYATAGFDVEPTYVWFHGYGSEAGWDVYNYADGWYCTQDYSAYWQYLTATTSWNFWNGSAWVPTDALGNAPYGDGFGPFGTWFVDTVVGGTYENYDVYIDLGMTYYSPDHTAAGATYWRVSSTGDWGYYDGEAWYSTAGFDIEPVNVWFHGYETGETGWDVYNYADGSYYTQDYAAYWQYLIATTSWNYWNGSAWVPTTGLGVIA